MPGPFEPRRAHGSRAVRSTLTLALVGLVGCAAPVPGERDPDPDPVLWAEVRDANDELERRLEAGDLAGVAALYADDALLLGPGGRRVVGREAIDAYWAGFASARTWDLEVLDLRGTRDLLVQRGRSTIAFETDGERRLGVVEFVVVWGRDEQGSLRVLVDAYWPPP